jgi:hypothetical protein
MTFLVVNEKEKTMKRKRIVQRRVIGISILTGRAPPSAHLIYAVTRDDGTCEPEIGRSLRTMPGSEHLNGTKKQKKASLKNLREDLYENLIAAAILLQPVENACLTLDNVK